MENKYSKNEITIIYKVCQNKNRIKLFGSHFIKNKLISLVNIFNDNHNKMTLIYNIDNKKK